MSRGILGFGDEICGFVNGIAKEVKNRYMNSFQTERNLFTGTIDVPTSQKEVNNTLVASTLIYIRT